MSLYPLTLFGIVLCLLTHTAQAAPPKSCKSEVLQISLNTVQPVKESFLALRHFSQCVKSLASGKVRVDAHTARTSKNSNFEYALVLSQHLGNTVKKLLIALGVERKLIQVIGYGFNRPICNQDTDVCRKKNNRVELRILHD